MAELKLGNKFECFRCGTKFYDLGKSAAVCPKCGTAPQARRRCEVERKAARPRAARGRGGRSGRRRCRDEDAVEEVARRDRRRGGGGRRRGVTRPSSRLPRRARAGRQPRRPPAWSARAARLRRHARTAHRRPALPHRRRLRLPATALPQHRPGRAHAPPAGRSAGDRQGARARRRPPPRPPRRSPPARRRPAPLRRRGLGRPRAPAAPPRAARAALRAGAARRLAPDRRCRPTAGR